MSVPTVHVLHGINLATGGFVSQLTDTTPAAAHELLVGYAAGHPQPLFTGIRAQKPDVTFTSQQLSTILTATGVTGASMAAGNTDLYLRKVTDLGVREAIGGVDLLHKRLRMTLAYLYWTSLKATHQQDAELACRLVPTWDGTNAPIVAAGSVAVAGTPAAAEFYTLGPVKLNGAFLAGLGEMTLDLGIEMYERSSDGDVFTSFCGVKQINPVLTLKTVDAGAWDAYNLAGLPVTALDIFLRRKTPDGGNYSDASAQHIKLAATAGLVLVENSAGAMNVEHEPTLKIQIRAPSAAGNALAISTAVAIA